MKVASALVAAQAPPKLPQTSGQVSMVHTAGFGTLDPAQGLAVLAAALDAASRFQPAITASPLLWGALLKPGAPRRRMAAYSEFALPQPEQQRAQPPQQELRILTQQRSGAATTAAPSSGGPRSRKQREADLKARLLGVARGVIGADITADQPLMEVSCMSGQHGCFWSSLVQQYLWLYLLCYLLLLILLLSYGDTSKDPGTLRPLALHFCDSEVQRGAAQYQQSPEGCWYSMHSC